MSERELLCLMAAIIHDPSKPVQESVDTALTIMLAADHRLYAGFRAPEPTVSLP